MEDTLGIKDIDEELTEKEWELDNEPDVSKNVISNTSTMQHLQVIPKKEILSDLPVIPATFMEKLSFFRAYTSTVSKIELLCEHQNNVKRFLWFYVFNVLCKSLPMTYVYLFLSTYSPDYHFFLPKMMPILYGLNFIFLITGFFGLAIIAHNVSMYVAYFIFGISDKTPWNRCQIKENIGVDFKYSCYNLHEFAQTFFINNNITFDEDEQAYKTNDSEFFGLAQIDYFNSFIQKYQKKVEFNKNGILLYIELSLWVIAACLRNHISKRYIWQILHRAQLLLCGVYAFSFVHLSITYDNSPINYVEHDVRYTNTLMLADFDFLAESLTAPPVAHIISSRCHEEVHPSHSSALISLSNSLFYIFRAMTSYLCKKYGENWVNASIIYLNNGSGSIFYSWPIYFSTIYAGDIIVLVFFALNAIVDYCTFLITFQCLIQTFVSEWKMMRAWCAAIVVLSAAAAEFVTSDMFCEISYILWTCISTLSETIVIFWFYPMGHLIDDITFHYGIPPTSLRVWSFVILPIFYLIKAYIIMRIFLPYDYDNDTPKLKTWTFALQTFLLLFGAVYNCYYYLYKKKRNFLHLFKPAPEWGPTIFNLRQLRKKFDSRKYIRSQASRELSSHLIGNTEMASYKLEMSYGG